mgnify:CR=1 FL=1
MIRLRPARQSVINSPARRGIKDLVSPEQKMDRPRGDDRQVLHRSSVRALPGVNCRNGPWSTVSQRFRGWRYDGTFARILERLDARLSRE